MKILYAEDNETLRSKVSSWLEQEGHTVIACENGQKTWHVFIESRDETPFDATISDNQMPKMTGIQFLQKVRESSFKREIPFFALSADLFLEEDFRESGVTDFIPKQPDLKAAKAFTRSLEERLRN